MTYKFKIGLAAGALLSAAGLLSYTWLAYAAEPPIVTVGIQASGATTTTVALGTIVRDKVIVGTASTTLAAPTGTVDFSLYPNTTCSGTSLVQAAVAPVLYTLNHYCASSAAHFQHISSQGNMACLQGQY